MSQYKVAAIPVTLIEALWDRLVPHLERVVAIVEDEINIDKVKEHAMNGDVLLVTICKGPDIIAVLTMDVRVFDTGIKALYLPMIGGDEMYEWADQFLTVAKAIAKDFGCTQLRGMAARKGWTRFVKERGWQESYMVIKCELEQ